ncbi:MAG TPA: aminotransferase class V-fold PLP-dependent enzyme [Candidatus Acidoferrales bacterium]|nr:aminotransferase class V-fold PLP-dependent enzyme [Candidatus Acidoferrales bacterium]
MDWQRWRADFPITERLTHFNHAGVSPVSRRVARTVTSFITEATVVDAAAQRRWSERGEAIRAGFARLVGAQPDEIAFVKNTSEGLSLIAAGLDWRPNDNVIAVDGEYPSNVYPWFSLRRWGVETRLVRPLQGRVRVEDVRALVDERTRLVSVSFVDWSTGARTDLAPIAELCRARGILFCVDGIQGVGAIQLDVERAGIDCLAVGGHKWLLAPEGCGCLFVSRRVIDRIESVLHGWKSVTDADTYLPYHFNPRPDAAKFEPGSPSMLSTYALGAAIDLLLEIGPEHIEQRLFGLHDRLAAGLRARGAEIVSPWGADARSGIVVFRLGDDPQRLCAELIRHGFIVRVRSGGIRVAPHFYNNEDDIDRFLAALDRS